MKEALFCTPNMAETLSDQGMAINAGSRDFPYCQLSPFYVWDRVIPVPGLSNTYYSRTVEGIWQGLKVIDNKTDFSLFEAAHVRKRRTEPYGSNTFLYGGRKIGYKEARHKIYVPAFEWMYHHLLPRDLKESFYTAAESDIQLFFFDVDTNADIDDISTPYSHSSLLVDIVNRELILRAKR